jgi:K+-transporting ATPase A subunit
MKKNMGTVDRVVRILAAIVVVALYLAGQLSGTAAVVLGIFAAVFIATSVVGTCPLYLPLKIDTRGKKG